MRAIQTQALFRSEKIDMRTRRERAMASLQASDAGRLREEIAILERRLAQIGPEGDCGYEKALIRFFEQQLGERRARLQVVVRLATGD
jgi:hypothetical protein